MDTLPIISMQYVKQDDGNYQAQIFISGFNEEQQAIAMLNYVHMLICGNEINTNS